MQSPVLAEVGIAWIPLNLWWLLSTNFKLKTTAAASRGFLATARLSCFFSHAKSRHCLYFRSEICCHSRSWRQIFSYKSFEILANWWRFSWFGQYFYCMCAETVVSELLDSILTTLESTWFSDPDFLYKSKISTIERDLKQFFENLFSHAQQTTLFPLPV